VTNAALIAFCVLMLIGLSVIGYLAYMLVDHLRAELSEYRRAFQLERDAWERERGQLLTRCMDPSLVPALARYDDSDVPATEVLSESEEIELHRQTVADTIQAEMEARGLA
jgi:hypothetical protein